MFFVSGHGIFLICSRMMLAALFGVVGVVFVLVSFLLVGIFLFVF